ncbi:beta-barrel assembly-enhancing protease [Nitrogeniibacter mangrovi]|nr:M48 family metalloprotease [Nitrogeniibacter mangrovi]
MKRTLALLLSACLATAGMADGLPELGDSSAGDLSPQAEQRLGEQIMRDIRWHDRSYLDDPETEAYLNALGERIVQGSGSKGSFHFFALREPTINAFALPGGFIGVHTLLIETAQTESELASVLGHEVGHVQQHHIARMIGKRSQSSLIMLASVLVAVLAAKSSDQLAQAAVAGGAAAGMQTQLAYSRDFEREADRIGLQSLEAAGFDVRGMPHFFERLQRESRLYENNAPAYLRTHPLTTDRIADMENRVASMRFRQVPSSEDFLLIQARLVSSEGVARDTLAREKDLFTRAKTPTPGQRYAYVNALMRAGELDEAQRIYDGFSASDDNPLITALGGELATARKQWDVADSLLSAAMKRHPEAEYLVYRLADARLQAGRAKSAIDLLDTALKERRQDVQLWSRLAQAYQMSGRTGEYHRAQGEVYAKQGLWAAAVEQLELAQRSTHGDFYTQSSIDARLRELRARADEERELARRDGG